MLLVDQVLLAYEVTHKFYTQQGEINDDFDIIKLIAQQSEITAIQQQTIINIEKQLTDQSLQSLQATNINALGILLS